MRKMIYQETNIDKIVLLLINGECVTIKNEQKKEVQQKLRQIKQNCTIVLSQLKNGL